MIQVDNEINSGILWPDGHTWDPPNWNGLAELLTAGYNAVKDCSPKTLVMLHIAEVGASYYPYWHGTLADLQNNLNDVAVRYDKDILLVETAYAFTADDNYENIIRTEEQHGYPFTPEGQAKILVTS